MTELIVMLFEDGTAKQHEVDKETDLPRHVPYTEFLRAQMVLRINPSDGEVLIIKNRYGPSHRFFKV